jgi:two-component system osmolarity sensor histidine kinase EnvZ
MPIDRFQQQLTLQWLGWGLLALLLALVAAFFIARRLGLPLQVLSDAAKNIGRGQSGVSVPETGPLEIRNLSLAFNHMSQELSRLDQDRALILAGVSHDLRTPLARLRLAVEMSGDTSLQGGMAQDIEEIDRILGQFLDFARYANAASPNATGSTPTMLRLSDIAQQMLEHYRKLGHPLGADLAPTPPQALHELALQRVLSNLIDNALRHADGTAIVLRTRAETNPASGQGTAILEVIDSGPGIAPALTERLKLPFVRLQDSRTGPAGAGLGLAIVERILRQYGGTLALLPRPPGEGSGLVARVTLPVSAAVATI